MYCWIRLHAIKRTLAVSSRFPVLMKVPALEPGTDRFKVSAYNQTRCPPLMGGCASSTLNGLLIAVVPWVIKKENKRAMVMWCAVKGWQSWELDLVALQVGLDDEIIIFTPFGPGIKADYSGPKSLLQLQTMIPERETHIRSIYNLKYFVQVLYTVDDTCKHLS